MFDVQTAWAYPAVTTPLPMNSIIANSSLPPTSAPPQVGLSLFHGDPVI